MRILILGGDGMLGHRLLASWRDRHEVRVTLRQDLPAYREFGLFGPENTYTGVDARSIDRLAEVFADARPEAVVNAVGIVKQREDANAAIPSIEINALLPHRLAVLCRATDARLVHISTDCVFSGRKGGYTEHDVPDAEDLYGRTKLLGEVSEANAITLRTSMIGTQIVRKTGLVEWFLAQRGCIRGYRRAIFSGFTTIELARIIEFVLTSLPAASGVYHVSSDAISKHELLTLLNERLGLGVDIAPDDDFVCDRSLDSTRFRRLSGYRPPDWRAMLDELAQDINRGRK
jgi:dTDP-4-dehydrorhamnose reductase